MSSAVRTYRYLRLAMVVLVVMLLASVVRERLASGTGCFEASVSAYVHTPAQGVFVASLVALGVCMIVIKGSSDAEDVVLNVGGCLAVVVGLVPTPDPATCTATPIPMQLVPEQVANNVGAALVAGAVGLAVTVAVALRQGDLRRADLMTRRNLAGIAVSTVLLVVGLVWFVARRDGFVALAHAVAAIGLFACIVGVVGLNARDCHRRGAPARRYLVILVLMVVLGGALVALQWFDVALWLLLAEATVIGLFAVFWLLQTDELWHVGTRAVGSDA
ncbi:hypothetical protein AERO_04885 [Aeromicrobium fastidiosum]|uniref:hypothetical protein n=1 Tax=Aeromicrobium fastidiosum TaxID=52699 RepID=UPI00202323E1|nr:hypothetical protein [Aeromicrobium fastidiosum]MCL8250712.1 hypothetical protein [Aeromicrobium fastidiosum]